MNNIQNISLSQLGAYQTLGANQTPNIGSTQLITCPVCSGSASQVPTNRFQILQSLAACSCCHGERQVRMTANGALFPLSAFA